MAVGGVSLASEWELPKVDGKSAEEILREFLFNLLGWTDKQIDEFITVLENAEGEKLRRIEQHLKDFIAHLEKVKKAKKLEGVFKALGILAVVFAVIMTVFTPSPMSFALLIVTVAMAFEPLISEAAGKESLIEKGMAELTEALAEVFGETGGLVASVLIMMTFMVLLSMGTGAGISAMSGSLMKSTSTATGVFQRVKIAFENMFKTMNLSKSDLLAIRKFMAAIEVSIMAAASGVQISMATVQFEAAKLIKEVDMEQAVIDWWNSMLDVLNSDIDSRRDFRLRVEQLVTRLNT